MLAEIIIVNIESEYLQEDFLGQEQETGRGESLRHREMTEMTDEIAYADDKRISGHLEKHLGDGMVFDEIVSKRFHNDVHMIPPSEKYPFNILVTSGMSALPMNVPKGMPDRDSWAFAELCILLPPDWPLDPESLRDERNYWPVRLLKDIARLPHDYSTWLGWGHTVANGDPAAGYAADTELSAALIIQPFILDPEFFTIEGNPQIHIFQILPLTAEELAFKREKGADELLGLFERDIGDSIYGPIDPSRKSAV